MYDRKRCFSDKICIFNGAFQYFKTFIAPWAVFIKYQIYRYDYIKNYTSRLHLPLLFNTLVFFSDNVCLLLIIISESLSSFSDKNFIFNLLFQYFRNVIFLWAVFMKYQISMSPLTIDVYYTGCL